MILNIIIQFKSKVLCYNNNAIFYIKTGNEISVVYISMFHCNVDAATMFCTHFAYKNTQFTATCAKLMIFVISLTNHKMVAVNPLISSIIFPLSLLKSLMP